MRITSPDPTFKGRVISAQLESEFVGRERELAFLMGRFDDAKGGRGGVVAISGEYGIGKTRLVSEFGALVLGRGESFTVGYCLEYLQAPYVPFVEALRTLLRAEDRTTERSRALRQLIADYSVESAAAQAGRDHHRKFKLFDEAASCLKQLASRNALAIAVDDIQWADVATLELLEYLSTKIRDQRILIALTCRTENAEADPAVARVLGKFARSGGSLIHVAPLLPGDVRYLIKRVTSDDAVSVETLDRIENLAEGNPLFVEELVRGVLEGAVDPFAAEATSPLSLRTMVQERVDSFDDEQRDILLRAAVIGRDFDVEFLALICKRQLGEVLRALRRAGDAQLIVPSAPGDRFAFRHAIIREALYSRLFAAERRELHARIAAELEARAQPDDIAARAYHWSAADVAEKAIECNAAAGDAAYALYAFRDAARFYERALDFETEETQRRAELCEKLGWSLSFAGFSEHARHWFDETLEAYSRLDATEKMVRVLLALSGLYWVNADSREALKISARALELPNLGPDDALRYESAVMSATYAALIGQTHQALSYLDLADAVACERPPEYVARFHDVRGIVMDSLGQSAEASADFEIALDLAKKSGDADLIARVASNVADFTIEIGDRVRTEEAWALAIASSREKEYVWQTAFTSLSLAWAKLQWGELQEARRLVYDGLAAGEEAKLGRILEAAAGIPIGLLLDDEELVRRCAHDDAIDLAFSSGEAQHIGTVVSAFVDLYQSRGKENEIRPLLRRAVRALPSADQAEAMLLQVARYGEASDVRRARELLERWAKPSHHRVAVAFLIAFDAIVDQSPESAARAAAAFERISMPYYEARCHELAGDFDAATHIYERIGATSDLRRLGDQRRDERRRKRAGTTLTEREKEVAELAAEGKSNQEIADRLGISKRTVDHHIESILSRLGLRSRFQLIT